MIVMDASGDTRIMWDAERPNEVAMAKAAFDDALSKGYLAYSVSETGERQNEIVRTFDPTAEKLIMAPAMRGG